MRLICSQIISLNGQNRVQTANIDVHQLSTFAITWQDA